MRPIMGGCKRDRTIMYRGTCPVTVLLFYEYFVVVDWIYMLLYIYIVKRH